MIPESTRDAVIHRYGAQGTAWVAGQTEVIASLVDAWGLKRLQPCAGGLDQNVVWFCERDGEPLALKTGYPEPELFTEMAVLKLWRGRPGVVQLCECDDEAGVMLMQRIEPGTPFRKLDAEARLTELPDLFEQVPMPLPQEPMPEQVKLPSYLKWMERAVTALPEDAWIAPHAAAALGLLEQLWQSHSDRLLLHGDLHHENMLLDAEGSYVAIDPKGVIGPRILEYGRFLHNFLEDEEGPAETIMASRAQALSGAYTTLEISQVGYIDLALSLTWSLNAGDTIPTARARQLALLATMSGIN